MRILGKDFATRAELSEALRQASPETLSLAGDHACTAGERVFVRVSAAGLEPGVFLEGVVQRRRADAVDVQVLPHEQASLSFLRAWATGGTSNRRGNWRYPLLARTHVHVVSSERTTGRLLHGTTVNLSDRGAKLALTRQVPMPGKLIVMIERAGALQDFEANVVWSTPTAAGIQLTFDRAADRTTWASLVASVRDELEKGKK